jgi:regulator of extracellular matrix RemA (YlzA/DUF370 family)
MAWLLIEGTGLIQMERIIAVGKADAAPLQRLLKMAAPDRVLTLTGGEKRRSILFLDSGHLVVTPLPVSVLAARLRGERAVSRQGKQRGETAKQCI